MWLPVTTQGFLGLGGGCSIAGWRQEVLGYGFEEFGRLALAGKSRHEGCDIGGKSPQVRENQNRDLRIDGADFLRIFRRGSSGIEPVVEQDEAQGLISRDFRTGEADQKGKRLKAC